MELTLHYIFFSGMFLKDLNFINEGNPDYTRSGLVNMNKRRQVCYISFLYKV